MILGFEINKKGTLTGVLVAAAFVVLNTVLSATFVFNIPEVQVVSDVVGRWVIIVFIAPVLEELFFKYGLFGIITSSLRAPVIAGVLLVSGIFTLYHFTAYGGTVLNSAAFIGAFVFSAVTLGVAVKQNNIYPSILTHALFNAYLFGVKTLAFIA